MKTPFLPKHCRLLPLILLAGPLAMPAAGQRALPPELPMRRVAELEYPLTTRSLDGGGGQVSRNFFAAQLDGAGGQELVVDCYSFGGQPPEVIVYGLRGNELREIARRRGVSATGVGDLDGDGRDEIVSQTEGRNFSVVRLRGNQLEVTPTATPSDTHVAELTVSDVRSAGAGELILAVDTRGAPGSPVGDPKCDRLQAFRLQGDRWMKSWEVPVVVPRLSAGGGNAGVAPPGEGGSLSFPRLLSGDYLPEPGTDLVMQWEPEGLTGQGKVFQAFRWEGSGLRKVREFTSKPTTALGDPFFHSAVKGFVAGKPAILSHTMRVDPRTGNFDQTRSDLFVWDGTQPTVAFRLPGNYRACIAGDFRGTGTPAILVGFQRGGGTGIDEEANPGGSGGERYWLLEPAGR